jgi:hypothetical protein
MIRADVVGLAANKYGGVTLFSLVRRADNWASGTFDEFDLEKMSRSSAATARRSSAPTSRPLSRSKPPVAYSKPLIADQALTSSV